ncbi:MAG: glycosyltransferase [Patescibacteria group bacterium]|nr:glycosyltransferase [Patescibacteria group bacterium]MCL5261947.1 glycosyltransferase [Patescibacteria group bacterium]
MNKPLLSVVIPAYQSGRDLPLTLIDADKFLREAGFEYEIVVADAKSADQTADIVRRFSALVRNLKLFSGEAAGHCGQALRAGIRNASGEFVALLDPIFSKPGEILSELSSAFAADKARVFDVFIAANVRNRNSFAAKSLLGVKSGDPFFGAAGFNRRRADEVFSKIRLSGPGAFWEVIAVANQMGLKIKTVDLDAEQMRPRGFFEDLGSMLRIAYGLRRDVYHLKNKNN